MNTAFDLEGGLQHNERKENDEKFILYYISNFVNLIRFEIKNYVMRFSLDILTEIK